MTNFAAFSAEDLHNIFATQAKIPDYYASIGVCTDTRSLQPGCLFVALKGERFDAHDHIASAIEQGAVAVLFEERWLPEWEAGPGRSFPAFARIVVEDSLIALADLARYHRKRFAIPVVAVAGANGKTTTKDLCAHVLSSRFLTLKTEANYNNRVGTPLTLLQLTKFHEAAVIEIGTNEPGEIEVLSAMVHPTHALITNIGEEHLEKLRDLDGVEMEETALYRYAAQQKVHSIVNMDDDRLRKYANTLPQCYRFGTRSEEASNLNMYGAISFDAHLRPSIALQCPHAKTTVQLQTVGFASALNALAALAVANSVGMSLELCAEALASYTPAPVHGYARMQIQDLALPQHVHLLNDCYNANPSSMRMALQTLKAFPARRRVAMLGDMRELGDATAQAHRDILAMALVTADLVVTLGDEMGAAAEYLTQSSAELQESMSTPKARHLHAASHTAAAQLLHEELREADVLVLKGSRGMALEKVIAELTTQH